jgi:glycerophosphoryl diester phosphodiesterase
MKKFFDPEPMILTTGGGGPGLFHITMKSMKNAISLGSDVIQAAVGVTKDKKIILFSNTVFANKKISIKGIESFMLNELKELYRDSDGDKPNDDMDELFPELDETLKKIKSHRYNFHLSGKDPEFILQFCDIISANKAEERVLVSSLSGGTIKKIRGIFPDIATGFPFIGAIGFYALHRSGLLYFKRSFIHDALILPERIGASYLANPGLIKEARSRGIRVYVLDVITEEQVARLHGNGADGFVTNYAAMVKRVMKRYEGEND